MKETDKLKQSTTITSSTKFGFAKKTYEHEKEEDEGSDYEDKLTVWYLKYL